MYAPLPKLGSRTPTSASSYPGERATRAWGERAAGTGAAGARPRARARPERARRSHSTPYPAAAAGRAAAAAALRLEQVAQLLVLRVHDELEAELGGNLRGARGGSADARARGAARARGLSR